MTKKENKPESTQTITGTNTKSKDKENKTELGTTSGKITTITDELKSWFKKDNYQQVKEFHEAFGHPVGNSPRPLELNRVQERLKWVLEELVETLYASVKQDKNKFMQVVIKFSSELLNVAHETLEKNKDAGIITDEIDTLIGQVDGLVDALYFIQGTFVELGINPSYIFDIVHEANMNKLGKDGKPIIRKSDGKILKPEGWQPPEPKIKQEIERQIEES